MLEYLAMPAHGTLPTSVDFWVAQLSEVAGPVIVSRESSTVTWLEVDPLRLRAYVLIENGHASAINFELAAFDPSPAFRALQAAAEALGWELYEDDEDDPDDDEDDDD